ncbi:MAG: hypothetical protein E6G11_00010 [Actinobacteria bacterium]|nr:MAG: hypothetical protein E6G11_00010 [Actinomycetota bacterium]
MWLKSATATARAVGRRRALRGESDAVKSEGAIARFLEHGGLAESTQRAYRVDLDAFVAWLSERRLALEDVDARVLAEYVSDLGRGRDRLAAASVARRLAAIRSCLRFTFGRQNVPESTPGPRRARRLPEVPKVAEIEELVEHAEGPAALALRNAALLELLYSAGLRSAEAVGLDLADVDFEREAVHVLGKGGKERVVPLGEAAALRLALYLRGGRPQLARGAIDAVFLSARGRRLDTSTVRRIPGGRRRPADDPGAPRARLALDDADLQPCRCAPAPPRVRPLAPALVIEAVSDTVSGQTDRTRCSSDLATVQFEPHPRGSCGFLGAEPERKTLDGQRCLTPARAGAVASAANRSGPP